MAATTNPKIDTLVLDANPLITLKPLRGLARRYVTTPHVVAELRDPRAREHWERLKLMQGVQVLVRQPGAISMSKIIALARKTGDYAVLSQADICILALTLELGDMMKAEADKPTDTVPDEASNEVEIQEPAHEVQEEPSEEPPVVVEADEAAAGQEHHAEQANEPNTIPSPGPVASATQPESLAERLRRLALEGHTSSAPIKPTAAVRPSPLVQEDPQDEFTRQPLWEPSPDLPASSPTTSNSPPVALLYDDPSSEDDGEGEWITPTNVAKHQARAKGSELIVSKVDPDRVLDVACMTSDFAMQNILLQMGLHLVSVDGKKIDKVKTWVLRCHACFKLCKDPSKKFCPSCGGPTLIRASVTAEAADPNKPNSEPKLTVHLKKNFQYRLRGTNASLPAPKMGRGRGGGEPALVLREDQVEWQRAVHRDHRNTEKEEKRVLKAIEEKSKRGDGVWMDQDWIPDLLVGGGVSSASNLPKIGYKPKVTKGKKH